MEFFLKHQIAIFRTLGSLLLVISIAAFFWTAPKKGYTENEIAAANVARMEARIASQMGGGGTAKREPDASEIAERFKNTREDQLRYTLIIMMIAGVIFLGYSFISNKNDD
ncbi:hypothetical protein [Sulfurimonas sp.]|uniref:hypothetical protein n=1 Tax=Sulfurimonas sp. TaxID=2022749 RepID=UPI00356AB79F